VALWHCGTAALWHCGTVALWHCGTVALRHCGTAALWHWGVVALRHCGTPLRCLCTGCAPRKESGLAFCLCCACPSHPSQGQALVMQHCCFHRVRVPLAQEHCCHNTLCHARSVQHQNYAAFACAVRWMSWLGTYGLACCACITRSLCASEVACLTHASSRSLAEGDFYEANKECDLVSSCS